MGFDFIVIAPLLPSHCSFSFVFGCGVPFLVSSSVLLSMIVQQLVVIPVLLQEGVSTRPSTLPSWTNLSIHYFFNGRIFLQSNLIAQSKSKIGSALVVSGWGWGLVHPQSPALSVFPQTPSPQHLHGKWYLRAHYGTQWVHGEQNKKSLTSFTSMVKCHLFDKRL